MVLIHRPLGYGPNALPLRHPAILIFFPISLNIFIYLFFDLFGISLISFSSFLLHVGSFFHIAPMFFFVFVFFSNVYSYSACFSLFPFLSVCLSLSLSQFVYTIFNFLQRNKIDSLFKEYTLL